MSFLELAFLTAKINAYDYLGLITWLKVKLTNSFSQCNRYTYPKLHLHLYLEQTPGTNINHDVT